jgi:hypothetical protein
MTSTRTKSKIRLHDAIVGVIYGISVILAFKVNMQWLYLAAAVLVLQIISPVTKFCPVYFILNKMMPDTDPIQDGK